MREAQLRDVKATFSAVVEQAAKGEGTVVTRRGRPMAVVVGYEEWERLCRARPSFADVLLSFPSEVGEVERDATPPRPSGP